ncbi:hypothetical protein D3C84_723500 [compost metagenome]
MVAPVSDRVTCLYSAPSRTLRRLGMSLRPMRLATLKSDRVPLRVHLSKVSSAFSQPSSTDLLATSSRILPKSELV